MSKTPYFVKIESDYEKSFEIMRSTATYIVLTLLTVFMMPEFGMQTEEDALITLAVVTLIGLMYLMNYATTRRHMAHIGDYVAMTDEGICADYHKGSIKIKREVFAYRWEELKMCKVRWEIHSIYNTATYLEIYDTEEKLKHKLNLKELKINAKTIRSELEYRYGPQK